MESSFVGLLDYIYTSASAYTHTKIATGKLGILLKAITEILETQMKPLFHPQPLHTLARTHHLQPLKPHSRLSQATPATCVGDWGWHLEGQVDYVSGTAWHSKRTKMPSNLLSLVLNLQHTCSASSGTCGIPVLPWFTIPLPSELSMPPAASPPSHPLWPSIKELKARKHHHSWYGSWCSTKHSTGPYREKERLYHHVSWAISIIVHLPESCTSKEHNLRKKSLSEICLQKDSLV